MVTEQLAVQFSQCTLLIVVLVVKIPILYASGLRCQKCHEYYCTQAVLANDIQDCSYPAVASDLYRVADR